MTKIVVPYLMHFSPEHRERLESIGKVTFYNDMPASSEEWLQRCQGFDIICTNVFGFLDKWQELRDAFVSVRFVGVGFVDPKVLKDHNVTLSNSPGCNRHAVAEWIVGMLLIATRRLDYYLNIEALPAGKLPEPTVGLADKSLAVLGKGDIGTRVGKIAKAFDMNVTYCKRGDDLTAAVKDADFVVDALSTNPSTIGLLDKKFFDSLKRGAIFITMTAGPIIDTEAMIAALDSGNLAFVVHDVSHAQLGDTSDPLYQRLRVHPRVYATPHIAFNTDVSWRIGNDMMIDNVEAWLRGQPIHVVS